MVTVPMEAVRRTFGEETIRRGRAYAAAGKVTESRSREDGGTTVITGSVRGTRAQPYAVSVSVVMTRRGVVINADCSCPVGVGCKHGVALLFAEGAGAARPAVRHDPRSSGPAGSPWARDLGGVLQDLEDRARSRDEIVPLALQVDYQPLESRWSAASCVLPIRPLKLGNRGKWVKTGVGWRDVQGSMRYSREHDPAQVEVLLDLASTFLRGYGQQNPNLLTLGPLLWPLLRRMRDTGMALIPAPGLTSVELLEEPLELRADLSATGSDVAVRLGLIHADTWWPGESGEVALIGEPAHGVALIGRAEVRRPQTAGAGGRPERALVLAPLRDPVSASVQRRLSAQAPLVVPGEERDRFESDYLPRLRRQLPIDSADGSVTLPEIEPPRLRLTVEWAAGLEVATSWSWIYPGPRSFGLDASLSPWRDPESEKAILDGLALPDEIDAVLRDPEGELLPQRSWTDRDLVLFAEEVFPGLRIAAADGSFELTETGQQRDFRAASEAPEVTFAAHEGASERDWLDLAVTITVDGEPVTLSAVLTALTIGQELVFTDSGRHVPAGHPAFAQLAELVAAATQIVDQPADGLRVGRGDLSLWAELEALGVVDEQAASWARTARALSDFDGLPEVSPAGLCSSPRPYQADGIRWLAFLWSAGLGGILADDMGLGKTLQTLALIAHAREQGSGPFLVVAPTSVIGTWVSETASHTPGLIARAVTSSAARREESLEAVHADADIVVTSYTLFRLEAEQYRSLPWGGLILDEAHTVKNHQGKTYQEVRRLEVPFRLAVTGTPFENRLMELWSLLSIVAPGLYPWPKRFTEQVVRPVEQYGDAAALARFRRRIRPFLLRRTKELVAADLPLKQEQVVEIALSPRHRRIYDTQLQRERQTVLGLVDDFERNRIAIFGALTRLRQLSLDPGLVDAKHDGVGSAKVDTLVDHLRELAAEGHRALVFSQFTTFLRRVRARLEAENIATVYLDGRTRNRAAVVESFRSGTQPAFLISLKAGGSGLTLTEADYVFVLDPWWNPAVEAQAIDRAHRIGQRRSVMAYRLVSTGTIEEKVMALKESKAALFAEVLDGDGAMAKAWDADDVRELFAT